MSTDDPSSGSLPRWSLVAVAGSHGAVFAWAGLVLPWSSGSTFTILALLLAGLHLATALLAALRAASPRAASLAKPLAAVWRASSLASLALWLWLAFELARAATYLGVLYGELGQGIGVGLFALIGLLALPTIPLALWGLVSTWPRAWTRRAGAAGGALALLLGLVLVREAAATRLEPLPSPPPADLRSELEAALPDWSRLPAVPSAGDRKAATPSLYTADPVACVPDPAADEALAVVTYVVEAGRAGESDAISLALEDAANPEFRAQLAQRGKPWQLRTRCVRAPAESLATAIAGVLADEASRAPVVIDVITGIVPMRSRGAVLDVFALRPGLDGVCDERGCLMPWQLIAGEQFIVNEPLPFVPDFRMGMSPLRVRAALGQDVAPELLAWDRARRKLRMPSTEAEAEADAEDEAAPAGHAALDSLDGLWRITTDSYTINRKGRLIPLVRMHEHELELDAERLVAAQDAAETNIARSQLQDGRFRYLVEPFSGRVNDKSWNLPRQAGTTLVMCELGRDAKRTKQVATRSSAFMAKHGRASVDARTGTQVRPLSRRKDVAQLGSTALPALAMLTCRDRGHLGPELDATLIGMVELLLAMQREDGSLYPEWDIVAGAPIEGPEPLYAGGQVIYALSMAEKLSDPAQAGHIAGLPARERLHDAIERAIAYYTGPYWDTFVRDFFWLEENWHCLAARASLGHHRNAAYEQFCLDYVTYKSRVPLDEHSGVPDEFVGGYSMGNLLIPVNTPAAGHGEALAAAMAIKQAQGLDVAADQAQMRAVLRFLVRQQWNPDTCFACTPNLPVVGGFSESMTAPEVRIDYTQHAWAALGHGGALVLP